MEVLGVIGGVGSVIGVINSVASIANTLTRLKGRYDYAALNITLVLSSLWTVKAALEAIQKWRAESADSTQSSQQLDKDLSLVVESCAVLVKVIERKIGETDLANLSVVDKVRFVNLDNIFKDFVANLDSQVRALHLLLTIFQCRTITERTEKLQRRDTRRLFRAVRESTASLEYDDEDLEGAASILSDEASVDFAIDPILLKSKVYQKYHPERYQRLIKNFPSRTNSTDTAVGPMTDTIERSGADTAVRLRPSTNLNPSALVEDPILAQNFMLPFLGIPFKGEAVPGVELEDQPEHQDLAPLNPIIKDSSQDASVVDIGLLRATSSQATTPNVADSAQQLDSPAEIKQDNVSISDLVEEQSGVMVQNASLRSIQHEGGGSSSHLQEPAEATKHRPIGMDAHSTNQEHFRPLSQASSRKSWHASDVSDLYSDSETEEFSGDHQENVTPSIPPADPTVPTRSSSVAGNEKQNQLSHNNDVIKVNLVEDALKSPTASRPDSDLGSIINFGSGPILDIVTPGLQNTSLRPTSSMQPLKDSEILHQGNSQHIEPSIDLTTTQKDRDTPGQPERVSMIADTGPAEKTDSEEKRTVLHYRNHVEAVVEKQTETSPSDEQPPVEEKPDYKREQPSSPNLLSSTTIQAQGPRDEATGERLLERRISPSGSLSAVGQRRVSTSSMPNHLVTEEDGQDTIPQTSVPIRAATVKVPTRRPPPVPPSPKRPPPPVPPRGVKNSKTDQAPKETTKQISDFETELISGFPRSKLAATPYGQGLRSPRQPSIQEDGPEFSIKAKSGSRDASDWKSGRPKSSSTISRTSTLNKSLENNRKSQSSHKSSAPPSVHSGLVEPTESSVDSGRSSLDDRKTYVTNSTSLSANATENTKASPSLGLLQSLDTAGNTDSLPSSRVLQSHQNHSSQIDVASRPVKNDNTAPPIGLNTEPLLKELKQGRIMSSLGILRDKSKLEKSSNRLSRVKLPSMIKLKQPGEKPSSLLSLAEAASSGNVSELASLLKTLDKASDINTLFTSPDSKFAATPLMRAAAGGHIGCMEALTACNATCTITDSTGATALHLALRADMAEAARWLFQHGKAPGQNTTRALGEAMKSNLINVKDKDGITPIHLAATLRRADTLALFVREGGDAHVYDSAGKTPLHFAIQNHSLPCIEFLVQQVHSKIEQADHSGETPLMLAAKVNGQNSVRFLLDSGADKGKKDKNGYYAIHHAARNGHLTVLEMLFHRLDDLELENNRGERPVHLACLGNHSRVVRALLRIGCQVNPYTKPPYLKSAPKPKSVDPPSIIDVSMNLASTPLHYACCKGSYDNADLLIRHGGMLNANQEDGTSPLMLACAARSPGLVGLLLRSGANPNAATSGERITALHIAVRRNDIETTKQLVLFGADTRARLQNRWQESPSGLGMRMNGQTHRAAAEYLTQHHQNLWNRHVAAKNPSQPVLMPNAAYNASSSTSGNGSYQYVNLTAETRRATGTETVGFFSPPTQAVMSPPSYDESQAATRHNLRERKD